MPSSKLKTIFLLASVLMVLHGIEEYLTGFYNVDPVFQLVGSHFESVTQGVFVGFQLMLWLMLGVVGLILMNTRWQLHLMAAFGILIILESEHLIRTILEARYYPGSITAVLFPVVAFFFWKELMSNYKNSH